MKVYISGKITGDPSYWGKFAIAEETLECQGHIVLNPAILPEGMAPADYMRICMAMLDSADAIVMLPDWSDSDGSSIEYEMARYSGIPTYILDEDGECELQNEKSRHQRDNSDDGK